MGDLARRIVGVRQEIGGFSSLNDLGQVLSLDATTIDRLRPEVVVLPWG
jgi:DNA uptake protein ComE-like DNA-binding protein